MKQDVSKLYKILSSLESDKDRFIAMQERRKELLEPITKEINPKAFEVQYIELGVELADIYSAMFDVQYEHFNRIGKGRELRDHFLKEAPKKSEATLMNSHGLKSIEWSKEIC